MMLGLLCCRRLFLPLSKAILPIGFTNVGETFSHEEFEEPTFIIVTHNGILNAALVCIEAHSSPCGDADIEQVFGTFVDLGLSHHTLYVKQVESTYRVI